MSVMIVLPGMVVKIVLDETHALKTHSWSWGPELSDTRLEYVLGYRMNSGVVVVFFFFGHRNLIPIHLKELETL